VVTLHVEYAERGNKYGILFIFSLFCEYRTLEYVRIHVIYRVDQAECGIYILVAASHEYVNTYSTRRVVKIQGRGGHNTEGVVIIQGGVVTVQGGVVAR